MFYIDLLLAVALTVAFVATPAFISGACGNCAAVVAFYLLGMALDTMGFPIAGATLFVLAVGNAILHLLRHVGQVTNS